MDTITWCPTIAILRVIPTYRGSRRDTFGAGVNNSSRNFAFFADINYTIFEFNTE